MSKLNKKLTKKINKTTNSQSLNFLYATDHLIIKYQSYLLELNKIRQEEINHQISLGNTQLY